MDKLEKPSATASDKNDKMKRFPDFIIIGAMKSATSSLHTQLSLQDGIFMSSPKEPNFFSDDEIYDRGTDWYKNIFSEAENSDICGESSTHYTKIPTFPYTISRIQDNITRVKFVYVVRHPIDRLISHYIHEWSQNVIKCDINEAVNLHPELVEYSLYHKQIAPYIEAFGRDAILIIAFQQIIHSPQKTLERICAHVGYDKSPTWVIEEKSKNISSQRIRSFPFYDLLVKSNIATAVRRHLVPKQLRAAIKNQLVIGHRPELNAATQLKLENIFDEDLQQLNEVIDIALTCATFHEYSRLV